MTRERQVGFAVLAVLGTALVALAIAGRNGLTDGRYVVLASFDEHGSISGGGALKVGHPVIHSGVQIGRVKEIRIVPDGVVAVLEIRSLYDITSDAVVEVHGATILGGKEVVLAHPDRREAAGRLPKDGTARVAEGRSIDLVRTYGEVREEFGRAATSLDAAVEHVRGGNGTLGHLLYDEEMRDRLRETLRDASDFSAAVRDGEGPIPDLVRDDALRARVQEATDRFRGLGDTLATQWDAVERQDGALGAFLRDADLAERIDRIDAAARDLARRAREGDGIVAAFLGDDAPLRRTWDAVRRRVDAIRGKIRDLHGEDAPA